jgi:hypothetical protein
MLHYGLQQHVSKPARPQQPTLPQWHVTAVHNAAFPHVPTVQCVHCSSVTLNAGALCRQKDVRVGEKHVTIRYDDTYNMYRPPRAHHCRVLHVVIARFDHYCPWTGTAIGLRNYRPFVLFLISCTLSAVHAIAFSVLHIVHHVRKDGHEVEAAPGGLQGGVAAAPTGAADKHRMSTLLDILPTPIMLIVLAGALCSFTGLTAVPLGW